MGRLRDLLPLLLTAAVVMAAMGAGVVGPSQLPVPLPESTETVPDSSELQRLATVIERTLTAAREYVIEGRP